MRVAIEQASGAKYRSIGTSPQLIFVPYCRKVGASRVLSNMVQKIPPKRGRPRSYDPDTALAQAMAAFWNAGYTGTSLDDITAGTGMNRPSLYGAFGDKRALYLHTLERYRVAGRTAMREVLGGDKPL